MEPLKLVYYKLFLSVRETADLLNVSTKKVYLLLKKGELHDANMLDSRKSISADEIRNYVNRKNGGTI